MTKDSEELENAKPTRTITAEDLAQHTPILTNYLRKFVRPNELDDALQTVMARALENLDKYRGDSTPRVWLLGIARNVGFEQGRRRQKAPLLASQTEEDTQGDRGIADADGGPAVDEVMGRKEEQAFALQALGNLSLDDKLVLLVTYVDGVSGPEAAEVLGMSFSAFRQRLSRARQALRAELKSITDRGDPAEAAKILAAWQPALDPHGSKKDLNDPSNDSES